MNVTSKDSKLVHIYHKQLKLLNRIRNSTVYIACMNFYNASENSLRRLLKWALDMWLENILSRHSFLIVKCAKMKINNQMID